MRVAILGAGAGGAAAAVELGQHGISTRLWSRSEATLAPLRARGGIAHEGVLGAGTVQPGIMTTDLAVALEGADAVLVCLPTLAHAALAEALADLDALEERPVVLNPGHTGGALEFTTVFARRGLAPPPVAEFSTLTYVARMGDAAQLRITGAAQQVWVAALPGGEQAVETAQQLYPAARRAGDVLATGLCNVNMVLHPPGAVCAAAWVEATAGDFTFYVDGLSDGVGRVMAALDEERIAVG
ncbi:MAG: NAD(P)-binding domain-containing protein, partial [Gammaproteobacteria bacterium]|nr:NAD(P)-binding domain-containing protein [Gammaproteobacteria bacterium]